MVRTMVLVELVATVRDSLRLRQEVKGVTTPQIQIVTRIFPVEMAVPVVALVLFIFLPQTRRMAALVVLMAEMEPLREMAKLGD